jgi:hypothetical protein
MIVGILLVIINISKILVRYGYLSDTFVSKYDRLFIKYSLHIFSFSTLIDVLFLNLAVPSLSSLESVINPLFELYDENSNFSQFDEDSSKAEEQKTDSKKEQSQDKNKKQDFSITLYGLFFFTVSVISILIIGK